VLHAPLRKPLVQSIERPFNRVLAGGPAVDADAQAWADAADLEGGSYTQADVAAASAFFASAKAHSYNSKLTQVIFFGGDEGVNALKNALIQRLSGVWGPATNHSFVAGDYDRTLGLAGDGSTKWLNTELLVAALTDNDTHLSVYVTANGTSNLPAMGVVDNSSGAHARIYPTYGGTDIYGDLYDDPSELHVAGIADPVGHVIVSRTSSGSIKLYVNGVEAASGSTASTKAIADFAAGAKLALFAQLDIGGGANKWNGKAGFFSIGLGLTAQNASDFSADLRGLMSLLGRPVP
jgi:hypothetical protein